MDTEKLLAQQREAEERAQQRAREQAEKRAAEQAAKAERAAQAKEAAERSAAERAEKAAAERAAKAAAAKEAAARAAAEQASKHGISGDGSDANSRNSSGNKNSRNITDGDGNSSKPSNSKNNRQNDGDSNRKDADDKPKRDSSDSNEVVEGGGYAGFNVDYPDDAEGEEGTVIYSIIVEPNGRANAGSLKLVQSSGSRVLDKAARRAVLAGKFRPKTRNGAPVRTRFDVPIRFSP